LIDMIEEPGAAWEACEIELASRGAALPLYHRAVWARAGLRSGVHTTLLVVRDAIGGCRAAVAIESARSRSLPGHRLLSILRLGIGAGGLDESALDEVLGKIAEISRDDRSILRINTEVFALDQSSLVGTAAALARNGFVKIPASRMYERTLLLDLEPTEEELFARIHKNARQGVRNISRFPVKVGTAESTQLAERLQELSDETRARSGGSARMLDWKSLIQMSNEAPHLSRIATLERTDRSRPEAILAFAWACVHGDVAEYCESGSTRADDLKVSTSYALLWDLILWSRRSGARWFDLGGITGGATHSDDPLGGISDFKRRFSQHEVEVGQEWELHPHPARATAARVISRSADALRSSLKWMRR
jgi:DNA-binding MarR family transcriptional regulator